MSAYPTPVDFDGKILRWNLDPTSAPIKVAVDAEDPETIGEFRAIVEEAEAHWNDVAHSYFRFASVGVEENPQVTVKLQKAIDGGAYSAGYSQFDQVDESGPVHCQILIAVDDGTSYVPFAKTALHELGHCLGLGHSLVPEAIMSYSLAKNTFALDIDDEAAAARLYPADGSTPKLPPGCAVGAGGRRVSEAGFILLLALLPLMIGSFRLCRQPVRYAEERYDSRAPSRLSRDHER